MVHIVHTIHIIFTDTLYLKKSLLTFNKKAKKGKRGDVCEKYVYYVYCVYPTFGICPGYRSVSPPLQVRCKSVLNPFPMFGDILDASPGIRLATCLVKAGDFWYTWYT